MVGGSIARSVAIRLTRCSKICSFNTKNLSRLGPISVARFHGFAGSVVVDPKNLQRDKVAGLDSLSFLGIWHSG